MNTSDSALRPVPVRDAATAEFFDAARRGRLLLQHCSRCDHCSLQGGKYCPECLAPLAWVPASGRARVLTWTRIHSAAHPGFAADLPYVIVTARTVEGPLLTLRLVDENEVEVEIGASLQLDFIDNGRAEPTPVFRRAAA